MDLIALTRKELRNGAGNNMAYGRKPKFDPDTHTA